MERRIMKQVLAIAIFATSWLSGLTTAEGCWFRDLFGGKTQTTYMLPVAAAPAPVAATCATTPYTTNYPPAWQPALYAPQTQYQTMWRPYPITTYSPVAANGLVPAVSYGVQANRVPLVALQPVMTAPVAVTAPPAMALPPASVAPTLSPSCNCSGTDNTAYYGSASAWSPVTTDTGSTWAGYGVASSSAATVAGYTPTSTANDGTASDWTPVAQADTASYPTNYAPATQSSASTTLKPWQVSPNDSSVKGATPWMSVEEYKRQQQAAAAQNDNSDSAPADEAPRLLPRATSSKVPVLDQNHNDQWQTYDDESSRAGNGVSPSSARANSRYVPPSTQEKQQLIPFNRPIPDPDRDGNGWDFDDKLQLQNRESRSARATTRWRAIPVGSVSSPSATASNLDRLLEPPRRPKNSARQEGGWQSAPR